MLSVEDWAEIRRLSRAEGLSIKEIARQVGVARNTVRTALRSAEPPAYRREKSRVHRRRRRARDPTAPDGDAADASDGDRRTHRLDDGRSPC